MYIYNSLDGKIWVKINHDRKAFRSKRVSARKVYIQNWNISRKALVYQNATFSRKTELIRRTKRGPQSDPPTSLVDQYNWIDYYQTNSAIDFSNNDVKRGKSDFTRSMIGSLVLRSQSNFV